MAMPTRQGDPLSEQERKVLSYLAQGLDYSGVGVVLGITQSTVRSHTKNIHNKLNVNKTVQAVVKYEEMLHEESLVNLRAEAMSIARRDCTPLEGFKDLCDLLLAFIGDEKLTLAVLG